MIVTIDGPAGAGKSTAARLLATELGFAFLDTGAMYRAMAWFVLEAGIDPTEERAVVEAVETTQLAVDADRISINGQDVTGLIRIPAVTAASSAVAKIAGVRARLVAMQREIARQGDYVCEGRDQGTVVFPDAIAKFFLTASAECRARRRLEDLAQRGVHSTMAEQLEQQAERDHRDRTRSAGPLVPADDAVVIDTTGVPVETVVQRMKTIVEQRIAATSPAGEKAGV
jgi:cytidylate kinase